MSPSHDRNTTEPVSGRNIELAYMRREWDRETRERLRVIENRVDTLEHTISEQVHAIALQLRDIANKQAEQNPALETINQVVRSVVAVRWMVVLVVGVLVSAVTGLTAWEAIRKWIP